MKTRVMVRKSESKTMFYVLKVRQRKYILCSERERAKTCHMCRKGGGEHAVCSEREREREHVVSFIQKERMERGTSGLRVKPHHEAYELREIICFNV